MNRLTLLSSTVGLVHAITSAVTPQEEAKVARQIEEDEKLAEQMQELNFSIDENGDLADNGTVSSVDEEAFEEDSNPTAEDYERMKQTQFRLELEEAEAKEEDAAMEGEPKPVQKLTQEEQAQVVLAIAAFQQMMQELVSMMLMQQLVEGAMMQGMMTMPMGRGLRGEQPADDIDYVECD